MIDFDAVAEQHQSMDGMPLIDYLPIGLPVHLLWIDSLVGEKRNLMPVEEFILKAIQAGVRSHADVIGTLGLGAEYGAKVLQSLSDEEYVAPTPHLTLRPKGVAVLSEAGERLIYEKTLKLAWSPLTQSIVKNRSALLAGNAISRERMLRLASPTTRLPPLTGLPLEQLPGKQVGEGEQIIRYLSVIRRRLFYIPAVLLLYSRGKNTDPLARVVIDGAVDQPISDAIAKLEMLPRLGLDSGFYRRAGAIAVDARIKPLGVLQGSVSLADVLRRKSTLRLGIEGLERQDSVAAVEKLEAKRAELAVVLQQLEQFPIRALLPFEVAQLVDSALQRARREVLITTTLPVATRLTALRLQLLEQALRRGVSVRILISDRPAEDELRDGVGLLLRKLYEMATHHSQLDVSFLRDTDRAVFEVRTDDATLGVSNEPPLGLRSREPIARAFSGHQLSGAKSVLAYANTHLSANALSVVERIKLPPTALSSRKKSSPSQR